MSLASLASLFRDRKPEEGDDLDGCALDFSQEKEVDVPLDPDPDED